MIELYNKLKTIAESEYKEIVVSSRFIGNRSIGSIKLRIFFNDQSFLDIWLSPSGKYSYHWEQRAQRGSIYRHDNAPDYPQIDTYPKHLHDGDEKSIKSSHIDDDPTKAIHQILTIIRQELQKS